MSPRAASSVYEVWHVSCLIYPSAVLRTGFAIGWVAPLSRAVYQQACGRGSLSLSPVSLPALTIYTAFVTQSNLTSSKYGGKALYFFFFVKLTSEIRDESFINAIIVKLSFKLRRMTMTIRINIGHVPLSMAHYVRVYCSVFSLMALFTRQQGLDEDEGCYSAVSPVSRPGV